MDLNTLFALKHLSVFSLGAYLGLDFTDEERKVANKKGEDIMCYFGIIPDDFNIPHCHCSRPMNQIKDVARELGYRFKCVKGHRKSPTLNTFITSGKLGANKIIQMAYLWILKINATTIQNEVNIFI